MKLPSACSGGVAMVLAVFTGSAATPAAPFTTNHSVAARTSHLRPPLAFERNQGQTDVSVQFLARTLGRTLFLKAGGEAVLGATYGSLRMRPAGRVAKAAGIGIEPVAGRVHHLIGSDPKRWRSNVPSYAAVRFNQLYPGIDLVYRSSGATFEYDFLVSPRGDPRMISLEFSGADRMELADDGDLVFSFGGQKLHHRKPRVHQISGQTKRDISGRYVERGGRIGFDIGEYDHRLPLVIDPVVSYGTFLGGAGNEGAFSVALDTAGNLYMTGITSSAAFPLPPGSAGGRTLSGTTDAFVAKLNPEGSSLIYAAYLGGSDQDAAMAVAVDGQGNAYLTGGTNSRDFPVTAGSFQTRFGGTGGSSLPPFTSPSGDGFVVKLNPSGTLVYSSYLGGTGIDQGYGIAVDTSGSVYVAGATASPDFPLTPGVLQTALRGHPDAFVSRVNPAGSTLLYSTFLGGAGENYGLALGLDSSANSYITGVTTSDDFPVTPGAIQSRRTGRTASFVSRLNNLGTALGYSTYLGGNNNTYGYGIAVDGGGSAHVTGTTTATDFPTTPGAYLWRNKSIGQGGDVFVTRLAPSGNSLEFSSLFGSNGPDFGRAIAVDASGDVYVTGSTGPYGNGRVLDFPTTTDAAQRCGSANPAAFLVRLAENGRTLKYSSYLGGTAGGGSMGMAIALGPPGKVYLAGSTGAADFPTTGGALQNSFGGGSRNFDGTNLYPVAGDAFLTQVDLAAPSPFSLTCEANAASLAPNLVSPGEIVSFFGSGIGPPAGVSATLDAGGRLPTALGATRVLFDGNPAPLLFVRSDQVNAVTPFGLAGKSSTQVELEYAGVRSRALTIPVTGATPGIFTLDSSGSGQAAALNEDGSFNTPSNPARAGSIVVLFATGAGPLDPVPEDGRIVQGTLPRTLPATAYVGSCQADVQYSGSAPGLIAGAVQFNLRIPEAAPPPAPPGATCGRGDVPVVLLFGGVSSQTTATISVR